MIESAFGWLGQLIQWFGSFFPRWVVVPTTHGWVKFVRGSNVKSGGAGIVWYWPAVTEFEQYPTARQTISLATQTITTTDGKVVSVSGMLVYEIFDLEKILAHTMDPDDTIRDIAQSSLHDVCSHKSYEELRVGQGKKLDTALRAEARKDLEDYGVRPLKFTLTTFAPSRVLRLVTTTSQEGI